MGKAEPPRALLAALEARDIAGTTAALSAWRPSAALQGKLLVHHANGSCDTFSVRHLAEWALERRSSHPTEYVASELATIVQDRSVAQTRHALLVGIDTTETVSFGDFEVCPVPLDNEALVARFPTDCVPSALLRAQVRVPFTLSSTSDAERESAERFRNSLWRELDAALNRLGIACAGPAMAVMIWHTGDDGDPWKKEAEMRIGAGIPIGGAMYSVGTASAAGVKAAAAYRDETLEKHRFSINAWRRAGVERSWGRATVELATAFESLVVPDSDQELSFRVALRAAWVTEPSDGKARGRVFDSLRTLYRSRSKIVHTGADKQTERTAIRLNTDCFSIFRRVADTLLRRAPMGDVPLCSPMGPPHLQEHGARGTG